MDDAVRNLSPLTMDSKTLDSASSSYIFIGGIAGVVVAGAVVTNLYKMWTTRNQPPEVSSVENPTAAAPLLQSSTGGRRLTRHRKNRSRKTRCKRRT